VVCDQFLRLVPGDQADRFEVETGLDKSGCDGMAHGVKDEAVLDIFPLWNSELLAGLPHLNKTWCIGAINAKFLAQMERILWLYALPYDWRYPVAPPTPSGGSGRSSPSGSLIIAF
jgi:hypothetical protein